MGTRKAIPLKTKLAAALLQLVDENGERLIPYADSKLMTADQVVSLFELDHFPFRVADGGGDEPWNLTWRLRAEHKRKTATIDQPQMAKQRRIRAREAEHTHAIEMKSFRLQSITDRVRKFPSRPFPKGHKFVSRPLAGRG
jgi:hypothetical protein